jgi:uncharacterized protein with HEPN domain
MSRKEDKARRTDVNACLGDIRDSAAAIEEYVDGITEARFRAEPMRQDAVVRRIEIIGEAADRIMKAEPSHTVSLAGVPLTEAKLMRNKVIHEYEGVDVGLVWDTAKNDVPDLRKTVIDAIDKRQTESR